jgi:outer membrane immunogenic protein
MKRLFISARLRFNTITSIDFFESLELEEIMRRNFGWRLASIIGFGLGGLGSAMAADLPVKGRPPAVVAEVFSWSGFYVGGNAGYDWGRASFNTVLTAPAPFLPIDVAAISTASSPRLKPSGFTGGGQAGYNWQLGSAVFGVEADIESFRLRASTTGTFPFPSTLPGGVAGPPTAFFNPTTSVATDWLFTARDRIGWANDHWLLYATGGLAVTKVNSTQSVALLAPFLFNSVASDTRVGWTVGAGFEYMFAGNWSVKGEYLYLDFGTLNGAGVLTPAFAGLALNNSMRLTANIARVGVNYHFGGPVVAKY